MFVRTEARNHGSLLIFGQNQNVLRTGNMDQQPNYDSGETANYSRQPSENYGEHPEESTGVFDRPAEQNAYFRQKNSVHGAQK